MRVLRWRLAMLVVLGLMLTACDQVPSRPRGPASDNPASSDADSPSNAIQTSEDDTPAAMARKVRIEVLSVTPSDGGKHVWVAYKATNTASKIIVRAKATISVLDADGIDIGSKSRWVISSDDGGIAPGASVENKFIIGVSDPQKAASARITIELVRGG